MQSMGTEEITDDRLETLWRQTAAEIKQKEDELQRLQERFKKLDDARSVIREAEFGGRDGLLSLPTEGTEDVSQTLKEAVLQYAKEFAGFDGKSASEVTRAL